MPGSISSASKNTSEIYDVDQKSCVSTYYGDSEQSIPVKMESGQSAIIQQQSLKQLLQQQQPSVKQNNANWDNKFTLESKLSESFRKNRDTNVKLKVAAVEKAPDGKSDDTGSVFTIKKAKAGRI